MNVEKCRNCSYYYQMFDKEYCIQQANIQYCTEVTECPYQKMPRYTVSFGDIVSTEIGDIMEKQSKIKVTLKSFDEKEEKILSYVDISCSNYETFKQIMDAITPILEKETIKKCD